MKKTSTKTKSQLVEENEKLKDTLRSINEEYKILTESKQGELTEEIIAPFLDAEKNEFKCVKINFNPQSGKAEVDLNSKRHLSGLPKDPAMSQFAAKELTVVHINKLIDKFLENRNNNLNKQKGE